MNSFYGVAGLRPSEVACTKGANSRLAVATPSTFHGSQSGATTPGPSNPAGCQLSPADAYARDACADGPPALITCYAERRG